ncbi:PH domain-containing protein [Candidatus Micrarchaeota archaeon]|nr:PH domain-containing protein [Candidatus Micrarchaeota archaeon]
MHEQDRIRDVEAQRLDPKIIIIWGIKLLFPLTIFLLFFLFVFWIFPVSLLGQPAESTWIIILGTYIIISIPYLVWVRLRYDNYVFYFSNRELIIRHGVIATERYVIPYEKIQDIHISRSVLERILSTASVRIETAIPGSITHERVIPAVLNYREFTNELLEKVEKARKSPSSYEGKTYEEEVVSLLKELLKEIKDLKRVTSKIKKKKKRNH